MRVIYDTTDIYLMIPRWKMLLANYTLCWLYGIWQTRSARVYFFFTDRGCLTHLTTIVVRSLLCVYHWLTITKGSLRRRKKCLTRHSSQSYYEIVAERINSTNKSVCRLRMSSSQRKGRRPAAEFSSFRRVSPTGVSGGAIRPVWKIGKSISVRLSIRVSVNNRLRTESYGCVCQPHALTHATKWL